MYSLMRYSFIGIGAACLILAACSQVEVKETLGLTRAAPDEFRVVARPPLSVPREFYLTPPPPGAGKRLGGEDTQAAARALVTGRESEPGADEIQKRQNELPDSAVPLVSTSPLSSAAEERLLKRAGSSSADPEIRDKLYREFPATEEEPGMIERLRGEGDGEPVVDAKGEAERLKKNKEAKKPVNEGEVPVVDPKQKTTIERLFE